MELLYLWIEKFGIIKNQGFNFGGEYLFEFDSDKQELTIKKNKQYIEFFFNNSNKKNSTITNVTAIVGKNGTGKTLILDFMKLYNVLSIRISETIIVCKENQNFYIAYPKSKMKSFSYNSREKLEIYFIDNSIFLSITKGKRKSIFSKTNFIFFSNTFDNRTEYSSNNLINISTNYLLRNYKKRYIENKLYERSINQTDLFEISEIENQLFFINNMSESMRKLVHKFIPKQLTIDYKFDYLSKQYFSKVQNYIENTELYNFLLKVKHQLENSITDEKKTGVAMSSPYIKDKLQFNLVTHFIFESFNFSIQETVKTELKKVSIHFDNNFSISENLITFLQNLKKYEYWNLDHDKINNLIEMCEIIKNASTAWNKIFLFVEESDTKKLIQYYKGSFFFSGNLLFTWRNMSSGEIAYLNLYSRFYSIKNKLNNKNIIILMDEPDLYMHPRWQQNLLKNFLSFVENIYSDDKKKEIQIILTSNNPMIVSDLPSNNIIFLDKEKRIIDSYKRTKSDPRIIKNYDEDLLAKVKNIINPKKELATKVIDSQDKQTFGANIHTLLADAFFLNEVFIGDFAKKRIQDLLNWLNYENKHNKNKRINDWYNTNADKFIEMIGDEVVKTKLKDMLEIKKGKRNDKDK